MIEGKMQKGNVALIVALLPINITFPFRKCLILLMRPARLERATFWFVAKRSIQLSYERD